MMAYYRIPKVRKKCGAYHRLFNRSSIISGKYPAYFGPGQLPDVVTLPGSPWASEYYPPKGWRPANSLLTSPQVVWLVLAQVQADQQAFTVSDYANFFLLEYYSQGSGSGQAASGTFVWSDGTSITLTNAQAVAAAQQDQAGEMPPEYAGYFQALYYGQQIQQTAAPPGFSGTQNATPLFPFFLGYDIADPGNPELGSYLGLVPITFGVTGSATKTVPNPCYQDYQQILPAFQQAAATVTSMRKGKTWVKVLDFTTASKAYQAYVANNYSGPIGAASMMAYPWLSYMLAPPETPAFVGTDFLMLHAGAWCSFSNPVFFGNNLVPVPEMISQGESAVMSAYSQFTRYAVRLYGVQDPGLTIGKPTVLTDVGSGLTPVPYGDSSFPFALPYFFLPNDLPSVPGGYSIAATVSSLNAWIATEAASQVDYFASIITTLQQSASDLTKYGYRYMGDESKLFSASAVIAAIAARFRFDPDTGADLPLPDAPQFSLTAEASQ